MYEQRASRLCCDDFGEYLSQLTGAALPVAADVAEAGGGLVGDIAGSAGTFGGLDLGNLVINNSGVGDFLSGLPAAAGSAGIIGGAPDLANLFINNDAISGAGGFLSNLIPGGGGGGADIPNGPSLTSGSIMPAAAAPAAPVLSSPSGPSGVGSGAPWTSGEVSAPTDDPTAILAASGGVQGASPAVAAAPAAAAAVTPPTPPTGGGINGFLRQNAPLLSLLAGGASIGKQLLSPTAVPGQANAEALAKAAADVAKQNMGALNGELPEGAKLSIANALKDTTTGIRAKYANLGLSGSTMEAQDIAAAGERARAMEFDMAKQLTQLGLNAANISNSMYQQIANVALAEDRGLQDALAAFAQAMGLGGGLRRVA